MVSVVLSTVLYLYFQKTRKVISSFPVCTMHCKEIEFMYFPEKELRSRSPNFHIHVSVSDLYIPTFGPPIFLQQNRQTDQRNNI
jgi:hypothetical protein